MTILWAGAFVVTLLLCILLMRKISKQSSRINQLESAILGDSTGRKIPYESLSLLNSLRVKAQQWTSAENDPALLTVRPVFIECLDNYFSKIFSAVPELNFHDAIVPVIEPRPQYTSLYITHYVLFWLEADFPLSFPCASREQAEYIADALTEKGIEARWTAKESYPSSGSIPV